MKRLHIGSGKVYLPGWTNVDLFSSVKADFYCDMVRLPYEPETFDLIYACHVLEHSHRNMVYSVLHHWRELLKTGGTLRLAVPDFYSICRRYMTTGNLPELIGLLYGGQDHPLNSHTIVFDYKTLSDALKKVGFSTPKYWRWEETDHGSFDDFSQAYLPHMDKKSGELMSLNMEAVK